MRLIAGLSENHQRPTATHDERLSFVVTLAGSAAAVSVTGSMRSEEIVSTMGGAPERLYFVPAAGSGGVRHMGVRLYVLLPNGHIQYCIYKRRV